MPDRPTIEVRYSVDARHFPAAAWLATELWEEFDRAVAVSVVPVAEEAFAVSVDGELIFQELCRDGELPSVSRLMEVKEHVRRKVPHAQQPDAPRSLRAAPWLTE